MIKRLILTAILLFSSLATANAGVLWSKHSYFRNFGGLNDVSSSSEIEDNEATDIQNIVFDTSGAIKKRYGYRTLPESTGTIYKAATGQITGLIYFKKSNGDKFLFGISNDSGQARAFYKQYDTSTSLPVSAWTDNTGILPSGYSADYLATLSVANDLVVITLDAGTQKKPFAWTATAPVYQLSSDANLPVATLNCYHKNILFLAGNDAYPSRVYFSNLGLIDTWTVTDFFDVNSNNGTRVTGLISAYDCLYIFLDKSIWRLSGSDRDSFQLEKMVDNIGTTSQQSLSIVNNLIYFTTAQGDIAVYDGAYTVKFLSQKIRNTIGGLNFTRASKTLGLAFSTYKYVDNDYYVAVSESGSGTNNLILLFDTAHNAWTKFKGINASAWTVADTSSGQYAMVFGDYDGYVHQYPSTGYYDGDVATSAISAHYQTKWFRYADQSLGDKYMRLLKTYCLSETQSPNNLTIEAKADYETVGTEYVVNLSQSGAMWDVALWDIDLWSGQRLIVDREEVNKGVDIFQLKFSNENVDEGFTVLGYENYIEPSDRI